MWSSSCAWWEVCASLFWLHLADCVLTCGPCPDLLFSPFSHLVRLMWPTLSHLHPHKQGHNTTGYQEKRGQWHDSYSSYLEMQWTQNIMGMKSTFITGQLTSLQKEKCLKWLTEMLKDIKNSIIMEGSLLISVALQSCRGRPPTLVTDITIGETAKMRRDNVGESCLPAILIAHYGMFIPFARPCVCLLTHFRAMCQHIQSHHAS